MNREQELSDLLLRWEQLRDQGQSVTLHELCSDCPELIAELEQQIRAIRSMDALLGTQDAADDQSRDDGDVNRNDAETVDDSRGDAPAMSTQSNYRVIRSHAKGGLGEVLVAKDELLGREVALKVIRRPHDRDPQRRRRFVQEAEITSRLEHPGVVPVHGIGQDGDGRLCYTMRFITGDTLEHAIRQYHEPPDHATDDRARNLALRQLLGRFISVCNTIAFAHSHGVIHRDIKPANIMLGKFGETLVVDWGLAKRVGSEQWAVGSSSDASPTTQGANQSPTEHGQLTQHGSALGTPAFMSPEQSRGAWNEVGPASDIYSLGATLFMVLTDRAPFEGRHVGELVAKVQAGDFQHPCRVMDDVAKPLEAICLKAMALRPADRYASALDLAADIENWLADQSVSAWREPMSVRVQRWIKRHRMIVTGAAAAIVVGLVSLGVVAALQSRSNRQLRAANDAERAAKQEADSNAKVADEQSGLALATLQTVLDDIQTKLKNVPAAHEVRSDLLKTALDGLGKVAANLDTRVTVDRQTLLAHRDLGDLFVQVGSDGELGGTEAAFRQYTCALEIAEKLVADRPGDPDAERDLALAMGKLGDVCRELGSTDQSKHYYTESLRIRSKLKDSQPGDAVALRALAMSFKQLGDLTRKSGSVEQAQEYFLQACDIREKILADDPNNPQAQRDLSVGFNAVGTAYLQLGVPDKSIEYHTRAMQLDEQRVADAPTNTQARQDLAYSYNKLGDVLRHGGSFAEARAMYEKSRAIRQRLVEDDPTNSEKIGHLVVPNERIGKLCFMSGEYDAALECFSRQQALMEQLIEADAMSVWNRRTLAVALDNIGDVFAKTEKLEPAFEQYRKSMAIRESLAEDASNTEAQSDLAASLAKVGDMLAKLNQTEQALELHHRAAAVVEPIVAADPRNSVELRELAAIYQRIGDANLTLAATDDARTYFGKMVALLDSLILRDPNDTVSKVSLAQGYQSLGTIQRREKQFEKAIAQYERALSILQPLEADGKLDAESKTRISELKDAANACRAEQQAAKP